MNHDFRILCSSSSYCVLLLSLWSSSPVSVSALFFFLQKAEAVNPFKAIPGIYDEEVAPVAMGGRHWGDAIFLGVNYPVYVTVSDEWSHG